MYISWRKKQKGLSIIEVLLAFGVLAIGVFSVIGLFPQIVKLNNDSWVNARMMMIAHEKMDELLANNVYISTSYVNDTTGKIPDGYLRWKANAGPTGAQPVSVEVSWIEKGRTKNFSLYGVISP